ncbi:hypothetical protein [Aureimonas sp. AU12]|uniref:hypothetical protein n=1 Tax=Aureimonas sp. AU12 TaxID=1638161 RepID=UPI000782692E|nr:hypothetical protein [Aureimonas sp. AU12]
MQEPIDGPGADRDASVLWAMLPSFASMRQLEKLERSRPPRFALPNLASVTSHAPDIGCDDTHWFATMETPRLLIRQEGFAPDFIWFGLYFASSRFREALALGSNAIEYRAVDMKAGSAETAVEADYRAFRAVQRADPVDMAAMYGQEPDRGADGEPTLEWEMSVEGPHAPPRRTVWKRGFKAPEPLFADAKGRLLATEDLAARVMAAGLRDIAFQNLTSGKSVERLAFRKGLAAVGRGQADD